MRSLVPSRAAPSAVFIEVHLSSDEPVGFVVMLPDSSMTSRMFTSGGAAEIFDAPQDASRVCILPLSRNPNIAEPSPPLFDPPPEPVVPPPPSASDEPVEPSGRSCLSIVPWVIFTSPPLQANRARAAQ